MTYRLATHPLVAIKLNYSIKPIVGVGTSPGHNELHIHFFIEEFQPSNFINFLEIQITYPFFVP